MKILMLVNWKIEYCKTKPVEKQPPDYCVDGEDYWFYRHFKKKPEVDVVDISSFKWLEKFEKNTIRFYIWQTLRVIPRLNKYDLIISHGMQSGVVISLWRRFFRGKTKHIVFDIGSFASASEGGFALKLMQYASKSIDGIIYHTSSQINYYRKFFPWIVQKSQFIRFGTDADFFKNEEISVDSKALGKYIICVGYTKRDWETLVKAYKKIDTNVDLKLVGYVDEKYNEVDGVSQVERVSIKELMRYIGDALFCILPLETFNYSYGQMTLMQQMLLEKCVVVANVPSVVDYVCDGKTAILYESKNENDLREKIEWALNNVDLIKEIGNNASKYLHDKCNEQIMAKEVEKYLDRIKNS